MLTAIGEKVAGTTDGVGSSQTFILILYFHF